MSYYVPPGSPPPPPPASRSNSYLLPSGSLQQTPPPSQQPPPPRARDQANPHHALLATWREHHQADWTRADDLAPAVRQLIDPRERLPAVRQKLRQLVASCPELEVKVVGNRARPVAFYRLVESKQAGLEG